MNIQLEVQLIHDKFGTTEMANYKIQLLCERYAKRAFDAAREKIKNPDFDPALSDPETMFIPRFKSFYEYLKPKEEK